MGLPEIGRFSLMICPFSSSFLIIAGVLRENPGILREIATFQVFELIVLENLAGFQESLAIGAFSQLLHGLRDAFLGKSREIRAKV